MDMCRAHYLTLQQLMSLVTLLMCSHHLSLVRGYWTQWTEWTVCSRHENQTRSRTCINPLPESGLDLLCGEIAETERRKCSK